MISPFSKSDTRPEWNSGMAFKDVSGSRIGLDSGTATYAIANCSFTDASNASRLYILKYSRSLSQNKQRKGIRSAFITMKGFVL